MAARLNLRVLLIVLIVTLLVSVPVYAQEATPEVEPTTAVEQTPPETHPVAGTVDESESESANGVTTLVLLIGLGAVALVGFGTLMRENYRPPQG